MQPSAPRHPRADRKGPSPGTIVIALVVFGLVVSGTIMGVLLATSKLREKQSDTVIADDENQRAALAAMTIPEFALVDQLGRPVDRSIFAGKWSVLEFMFSACTLACPVMKGNLLAVQMETPSLPVQFVSVTVDPVNDTPEYLREYSQRFGVAPDKWRFLSGDQATIDNFVASLGFATEIDPSQTITRPDGSTMPNIIHPSRFLVISPDVRVVAMYDGLDRDAVPVIARDLKRLIRTSE